MTLAFSTELNGKPTNFVEKIWESILQKGIEVNVLEFSKLGRESLPKNYKVGTHKCKLHTIRRDSKNRWKAGNDIHFVINNRTPQRFQFAPVVKCLSTQKVEIRTCNTPNPNLLNSSALHKVDDVFKIVKVDDILLTRPILSKLAINDGFGSVEDFFSYFSEDFTGRIIHWTTLKY